MGLGDVIFPGMLVISSLTYMPEVGEGLQPIRHYVSRSVLGRDRDPSGWLGISKIDVIRRQREAQPGLPLLNGGAIMGYIISELFVGPTALWQDISLF